MQTNKVRPEPKIPDHEVLRKIGGGAYGEVWLARGVTGALRAVKTVWHNDFDDERGFEREFDGILKYEPISRDHPGLVHILHVGRSEVEGEPFYYYVMELGDDVVMRREINPVEYEPRTLRSDMKGAEGKALDVEDCITVGRLLAEGLEHLHQHGLAHRDVKPSNIIFVDGKAKLADIGLVALRGQQTFVGTEGFVPPEGPGSAQADVYSLGKVLYEMVTGKDRLDFPELPDELPEGAKLKRWRLLNSVICDVCEPKISRRKIQTAGDLAAELARLEAGRRRPVRVRPGLVAGLLAAAVGVVGAGQLIKWEPREITSSPTAYLTLAPIEMVDIHISSEPPGARVFSEEMRELGITPTKPLAYPAGSIVKFTLKRKGYRDEQMVVEVADKAVKVNPVLSVYRPPEIGTEWADALGTVYSPEDDMHVSRYFVSADDWKRYLDATRQEGGRIVLLTENGMEREVVIATEEEAQHYTQWIEAECRDEYLEEEHWIEPRIEKSRPIPEVSPEEAERRRPFWCVVRKHNKASTWVSTDPGGADLYLDGEWIGVTKTGPFKIEAKLGKGEETQHFELIIEKPGYKRKRYEALSLSLDQHDPVEKALTFHLELENILSERLENSLGMEFVPVGKEQNLLASIWETRVQDYAAYVKDSKGAVRAPVKPDFPQGDDHPVVNVSREDAEGFCRWLTKKEHASRDLENEYEYRLPTDAEWSMLAGLEEKSAEWPMELNGVTGGFYWGNAMPPPTDFGNFADEATGHPEEKIGEYFDGHQDTAPVGTYNGRKAQAWKFEICDLEGNVLEWVSDDYSADGEDNVARGGCFRSFKPEHLQRSARWWVKKGSAPTDVNGFRVVLAKVPAKTEKESAEPPQEKK